jgi:hypothetical protein
MLTIADSEITIPANNIGRSADGEKRSTATIPTL